METEFVSLQQGIDEAGSPVRLLWKPDTKPWRGPVVESEYVGWRREQEAWRSSVTISDLSYHMSDTFLRGPDAARLLSEVSANNIDAFAIGQAKQFVPVAPDGRLVIDGILLRESEESFVLTGMPPAQTWVAYHARTGGYDVEVAIDPEMTYRTDQPRLSRMQVQGPRALELVEIAFGAPLPPVKFFHSVEVELDGIRLRALRHGMAAQAGYEFIGAYSDHAAVKAKLLAAGESLGVVHIGALAYPTMATESGWVSVPTPAIYVDPRLAEYRKNVGLHTFEGQFPIHGSFYSDDITDYYVSPWELGYGRSISLAHDFVGRDALIAAKEQPQRVKVTLEYDRDDVRRVFGDEVDYLKSVARNRVESADSLVGLVFDTSYIHPLDSVLSIALVDAKHASPGTVVEVVCGEHPGHGVAPDADLGFPRLRATVRPSPYDEYARTAYRHG